jgi:hypothetical protein
VRGEKKLEAMISSFPHDCMKYDLLQLSACERGACELFLNLGNVEHELQLWRVMARQDGIAY